jgi:hypothetical protein
MNWSGRGATDGARIMSKISQVEFLIIAAMLLTIFTSSQNIWVRCITGVLCLGNLTAWLLSKYVKKIG